MGHVNLWYHHRMAKRNLTLQLDDETIRRAKVIAASRDTSVSRLVADQIAQMVERDDRYESARRRFLEHVSTVRGSSGGEKWNRDQLHDRDSLRSA